MESGAEFVKGAGGLITHPENLIAGLANLADDPLRSGLAEVGTNFIKDVARCAGKVAFEAVGGFTGAAKLGGSAAIANAAGNFRELCEPRKDWRIGQHIEICRTIDRDLAYEHG